MHIQVDDLLPPGRPMIYLERILLCRQHPKLGRNPCVCAALRDPHPEYHSALVNGLRRILPFMYRTVEQAVDILLRYGIDFQEAISQPPTSFKFQWAHTGEILFCAYFEEIEGKVVLVYKWRLNTTKNQHQFGMDLMGFDLDASPPAIYVIAAKTTQQGEDGTTPSVVYDAIRELKDYLAQSTKLDDDLEIIAANLHTDKKHRTAFLDWYDPYTEGLPDAKPRLVAVPAFVAEEQNWQDKYAVPAIEADFSVPGMVRVICVDGLDHLVRQVFSRG